MSIVACPKPPASLASHYRAHLLRCDIPQPAAGKRWTATDIDDESRDASERDRPHSCDPQMLGLATNPGCQQLAHGRRPRPPDVRCPGRQCCTCMAPATCRRVVYRVCGFTRTICARAGVPRGMRWPNASTTADTSREAWSRPLPVLTTALLRPMSVGSRLPGWVAARASRESRAPADPGPAWNWARLTRASGGLGPIDASIRRS